MGKTAFSMNIAEHGTVERWLPVSVFSMEMGGTQLEIRAIGKLSEAPMYIGDTAMNS